MAQIHLLQRNKHCWDWWNLEALSDNEEVFEKPEEPQVHQPKSSIPSPAAVRRKRLTGDDSVIHTQREKIVHQRKPFVRAKSAEPESNLSRRKSTSLPEVHRGLVGMLEVQIEVQEMAKNNSPSTQTTGVGCQWY